MPTFTDRQGYGTSSDRGAAYAAHPERFRRRPTPPTLPTKAWINQPPAIIETEETLPTNQAA
ncbi:hypothetical protein [Frankia tisae]|uniref:hypothetical protein n=1 Tax=Frankia tisae TaxID=2950104 RepID=UPI0021BE3E15|nr:hypothetical protein [Frankia tisae]